MSEVKTIDDLFEDSLNHLSEGMLEEAREKLGNDSLYLAVAVLTDSDENHAIVYALPEWGDGEGTAEVESTVERSRKYLREGERIDFRKVYIDAANFVKEPGYDNP